MKYTAADIAWLRERVAKRQAAEALVSGRRLSVVKAIEQDANEELRKRGLTRVEADKRARRLAKSLAKLLARRR